MTQIYGNNWANGISQVDRGRCCPQMGLGGLWLGGRPPPLLSAVPRAGCHLARRRPAPPPLLPTLCRLPPRPAPHLPQYAFGPGFINWNGGDFPDANTRLAAVKAPAKRGSDTLTVDTLDGLHAGKVRAATG
jgi:hypothetical protein